MNSQMKSYIRPGVGERGTELIFILILSLPSTFTCSTASTLFHIHPSGFLWRLRYTDMTVWWLNSVFSLSPSPREAVPTLSSQVCFPWNQVPIFRLVFLQSVKSCPTLCSPMGCSSSVHEPSQARILESLQFHSPGDLPDPGMETKSPVLGGKFFTPEPPGSPYS